MKVLDALGRLVAGMAAGLKHIRRGSTTPISSAQLYAGMCKLKNEY